MIYAKVCDASALERLDAALCQATSLKWLSAFIDY